MKKILILMLCMILLMGTISAWEFDNIKEFDKGELEYGKIHIYNSFIIPKFIKGKKLAEYTLIKNTDQCLINCYAEGTATLYKKDKLFSDLKFKGKNGNFQNIKSSKILIKENISYQIDVIDEESKTQRCDDKNINGTIENICYEYYTYKNETKYKLEWKEYNFEKLEAGIYTWRIEGKKNIGENIDWIGSAFGKEFSEWAWWDSDWINKKEIKIFNNMNITETNYSVRLNVTYDANMLANFSDLRFLDGTESVELGHWLEQKVDSAEAIFHAKTPLLTALANNSIYMYYNNPSASSDSDIRNAFLFGDDFNTGSLDAQWTSGVNVITALSGEQINITGASVIDGTDASILLTGIKGSYELSRNVSVVMEIKNIKAGIDNGIFSYVLRNNSATNGYSKRDTTSLNRWYRISPFSSLGTTTSYGLGSYHNITINRFDNGTFVIITDGSPVSLSDTDILSFDSIVLSAGNLDEMGVNMVYVRKLLEVEPTSVFELEQLFAGVQTKLISPINALNSSFSSIEFSVNSTPLFVNLTNVTLFVWNNNGSLFNTNFSSLSGNVTITSNLFLSNFIDGDYIWNALTKGTQDTENFDVNRTFTVDANPPILNVTSPTGEQGTFISGRNLTLSWQVSDINLETCFYDYQGVNTTVTCGDNNLNFTVNDSSLRSLIFYANDTFGNLASNFTLWDYSFIEEGVIFNQNVSETSLQLLLLNLSTGINILSISSTLNYNGTEHISDASCTGQNCTLTNNINIPLVTQGENQIKDFFWAISIFNGTSSININTSTRTQNVSRIHLESCNSTFATKTLNFTVFNEINLTKINPFKFDATFNFWKGGGTVKRNISFINTSTNEVNLCLIPNGTMFIDGQIEYNEPTNITFVTRNYFFQNDTIDNTTRQDIPLFLLPSLSSTTFILQVQDDNLLPLTNHLIFIQRFYPGEDEFRTVQISKTDDNGKTVGFFETETVDYRFLIKSGGVTLLTTTRQKIVGETVPFTIIFTIGEDLGKPWAELEELEDLIFSLLFNKTSNIVTYTYVDTSNNFTLGTLIVEIQNLSFSTNNIICNVNSSQPSATLTCSVGLLTGNSTGTYISKGFITRGQTDILIIQQSFIIETITQIVGLLGVLLAWFIILIASFTFKFNEIAGIFMINAAIIFVNMIGLVSFGLLSISALIAVSIIIVVVMEK